MGLVAPWHVGSSQTRDQTCVPCIGRWILNHCATREVPENLFASLQVILIDSCSVNSYNFRGLMGGGGLSQGLPALLC